MDRGVDEQRWTIDLFGDSISEVGYEVESMRRSTHENQIGSPRKPGNRLGEVVR